MTKTKVFDQHVCLFLIKLSKKNRNKGKKGKQNLEFTGLISKLGSNKQVIFD